MAPQINYKPGNKNCVDEKIKPPSIGNACALLFIIVGIFTWFIRNIIYLYEAKTDHAFMVNGSLFIVTNMQNQTIVSLPLIFCEKNIGLTLWLALSGPTYFFLLLRTLGSSFMSKIWTIIGVTICAVMVVGPIWRMSLTIIDFCTILYYGVALISYLMTDPYQLAEIIRKISAAAFFFPTMHLFGFAAMIMCFCAFVITSTCFYIMDNTVSSIFCLIGGIYLILLIFIFATLVIAECVTTWSSSKNKEELSGCVVFKSFDHIARNYGGTLMICSTVIMPIIALIYTCCIRISMSSKSDSKSFFMKLLTGISAIDIAFWGVSSAIFMTFIEISKITSYGGVITFFPNNARCNKDLMNKEDIYYGLGLFMFAVAYTTVVVGVSLLILTTKKEKEETVVQEMTQNQNNAQEQCEKGHIQLMS